MEPDYLLVRKEKTKYMLDAAWKGGWMRHEKERRGWVEWDRSQVKECTCPLSWPVCFYLNSIAARLTFTLSYACSPLPSVWRMSHGDSKYAPFPGCVQSRQWVIRPVGDASVWLGGEGGLDSLQPLMMEAQPLSCQRCRYCSHYPQVRWLGRNIQSTANHIRPVICRKGARQNATNYSMCQT